MANIIVLDERDYYEPMAPHCLGIGRGDASGMTQLYSGKAGGAGGGTAQMEQVGIGYGYGCAAGIGDNKGNGSGKRDEGERACINSDKRRAKEWAEKNKNFRFV